MASGLAYTVDSRGNLEVAQTDGLGSVRTITDSSGSIIQTYRTGEFGIPTLTQGSSTQPFQFTGQQRDGESGLYYLRARMYDPVLGRFLSRDPLVGHLASPLSLNRFSYVQNNPVNLADPSGLDSAATEHSYNPCFFGGNVVTVQGQCDAGALPRGGIRGLDEFLKWLLRLGFSGTIIGGISEMPRPNEPNWVVRGGVATPQQLKTGVREHRAVPGLIGFSVQYSPGKSIGELAVGRFPNKQISVSTVERLRGAAAVAGYNIAVVPSPGIGNHATVTTPYPLPDDLAVALASAFTQMPNPAPVAR